MAFARRMEKPWTPRASAVLPSASARTCTWFDLHAEVDDAKGTLRTRCDSGSERRKEPTRTERGKSGNGPKRHVQRMAAIVRRSSTGRLAAGARATTTPRRKIELSPIAQHLNEQIL